MTSFRIYKIHFTTPIHLGDNRDDYGISLKTIQSDTLYSAIISCLAKVGEPIPDNGDLQCSISSLFPFYQKSHNQNPIFFLPKHMAVNPHVGEDMVEHMKTVKNVSWLDLKYFTKLIKGESLFDKREIMSSIQGAYMTDSIIDKDFIYSNISPRVSIVSRNGEKDAKLFYMDRIYFKDYSGLFFICDGDTTLIEKGLKILQYEGIGTDRNVGNGLFEYEADKIDLELPTHSDYVMSLSIFIPENEIQLKSMIQGKDVAYDFTRRGGWITTSPYNTLRKSTIYTFSPASVFSSSNNNYNTMGKIVNLTPDIDNIAYKLGTGKINHPIWRCGKSIFIPIKL